MKSTFASKATQTVYKLRTQIDCKAGTTAKGRNLLANELTMMTLKGDTFAGFKIQR